MRDIFVISDTHFSHSNILNFKDKKGVLQRPEFNSVDHMNEIMIDNWNQTVKENDIVYHLGDVIFDNKTKSDILLSRLNGKKRLILGNHDDIKRNKSLLTHFQKIYVWRYFKEHGVLFTHIPLHISGFENKEAVNVHGHIHKRKSPKGPYINMCVEVNNYTPVHINEIAKKAKKLARKYYV